MDIGCHLPTQGPVATREALLTFAREAERHRMASLWVSDHVVFPRTATGSYPGGRFPHPPDKAYLEPVAVLAAAAVCTTQARLGASVFILGHRHPVVMAKMLTTIDALSEAAGSSAGWAWAGGRRRWRSSAPRSTRAGVRPTRSCESSRSCGRPTTRRSRASSSASATSASPPSPCRSRIRPSGWAATAPAPSGAWWRSATAGTRRRRHPPSCATPSGACAPRRRPRKRPFESLALSLRFALKDELLAQGPQAVIDLFAEYKRLGLGHLAIDFRRDDLGKMLELLELIATKVRPAVA